MGMSVWFCKSQSINVLKAFVLVFFFFCTLAFTMSFNKLFLAECVYRPLL